MPLPLLFAFAVAQGLQDQEPPATPALAPEVTNLTKPYEVIEPNRLSITPLIDGRIEEEEWDELGAAGPGKAYFQWEPGKLHIAAVIPDGRDFLASFDLRKNGWLIGSDNLQIRIKPVNGVPTVFGRLLDATRVSGPTWIELPGFTLSSTVAARVDGGNVVIEATLNDPGIGLIPVETGAGLAVRMDAPLAAEELGEPFLPRVLTNVSLQMQRSVAFPNGFVFNPEGLGKTVAPGEWVRIRLTFNGNNNMNLTRLALRSEGFAKDVTNKLEVPFPKFDNKGRAFVDYETTVADTATLGYRILRGEMKSADGISSMLQSTYRIAPPVDFDLVRQQIAVSPNDRSQKYAFYVRSNTGKRITGSVTIEVPSPLRVLNGTTRKIEMAGRQRQRMDFEVFLPAGTSGSYPVTFKSDLNGVKTEQVGYFTVGGV